MNRDKQRVCWVLVRKKFKEFRVYILEVYNKFDFLFHGYVLTPNYINILFYVFHFIFSIMFGCYVLSNKWYQSHGKKAHEKNYFENNIKFKI